MKFISLTFPAVSNVATDVDLGLKEIQQMLEEEAKQEEEFQVRCSPFVTGGGATETWWIKRWPADLVVLR